MITAKFVIQIHLSWLPRTHFWQQYVTFGSNLVELISFKYFNI